MSPGRLGRGVDALFGADSAIFEHSARLIAIDTLRPNPNQPRRTFAPDTLNELADSIRNYGIIQPIIVEEQARDDYVIIAGERRFRAARIAGLSTVPVICRKSGETERLELTLVENIQRDALSALEEAHAYQTLLEQTSLTQAQLSKRVGKSRPAIANAIRLLSLPAAVQRLLEQKKLTAGHARAVLVLPTPDEQCRFAAEIVRRKLSVRDSEELARTHRPSAPTPPTPQHPPNYELLAVEEKIRDRLMTKVTVKGNDEEGKIIIQYHSLIDLNRIYKLICLSDEE